MSRNKLYSERLEICLTPDQYKKLKKHAECNEMTMNQLIRELIKSFLSQ